MNKNEIFERAKSVLQDKVNGVDSILDKIISDDNLGVGVVRDKKPDRIVVQWDVVTIDIKLVRRKSDRKVINMEFEEQFKEVIRQSINYLILTDGNPSTTIDELALKYTKSYYVWLNAKHTGEIAVGIDVNNTSIEFANLIVALLNLPEVYDISKQLRRDEEIEYDIGKDVLRNSVDIYSYIRQVEVSGKLHYDWRLIPNISNSLKELFEDNRIRMAGRYSIDSLSFDFNMISGLIDKESRNNIVVLKAIYTDVFYKYFDEGILKVSGRECDYRFINWLAEKFLEKADKSARNDDLLENI